LWPDNVLIITDITKTANNTPTIKVVYGERAEIASVALLDTSETKVLGSENIYFFNLINKGIKP